MFESFDRGTGSLNAVNIGLGILVLLCCILFLRGLLDDLLEKLLHPKANCGKSEPQARPGDHSRLSGAIRGQDDDEFSDDSICDRGPESSAGEDGSRRKESVQSMSRPPLTSIHSPTT